jgi:hypothetical protein
MKINPYKSKTLSFTRARVKDPLKYTRRDQKIPEDNCCKYLGIIIRNGLSWADQAKLNGSKSLEGITFCNAYCKKGKLNTKSIAYKSLVRPILE